MIVNVDLTMKKYARGYLPSLPIFYVFAERGEYIKDTFGQARHRKLAHRAGHFMYSVFLGVTLAWSMQSPESLFFDLQQLY